MLKYGKDKTYVTYRVKFKNGRNLGNQITFKVFLENMTVLDTSVTRAYGWDFTIAVELQNYKQWKS